MTLAEQEVEVRGHPIRYRSGGRGDPLVLVHGLSGSTRWWDPCLPPLLERRQVYLVDLPGFGAMRAHPERFVLAEAAGWLAAWLEAAEVGPADVAGHSMGGGICARLAAKRPELVQRLVLVTPSGLATGRRLVEWAGPLFWSSVIAHPRLVPTLVRDALRTGPLALWRAARQVVAEDIRPVLPEIRAPTLLVFGGRDKLVPAGLAAVYCDEIPDARLIRLEDAGHVPMFERPDEFAAVLLDFLS